MQNENYPKVNGNTLCHNETVKSSNKVAGDNNADAHLKGNGTKMKMSNYNRNGGNLTKE